MPAIHDALPNTAIGALRVSPGYGRALRSIRKLRVALRTLGRELNGNGQ